jgi:hypothetical protein
MITIDVNFRAPSVTLNRFVITTAPTVQELHELLGNPDRIDAGETPAPVGHRNNQIHIYDQLGLTVIEHHYTQRIESMCCWFETEEPRFRFTPSRSFSDTLVIDDVVMPLGGDVSTFATTSPVKYENGFGGLWRTGSAGFGIHLQTRGKRLRSGRRSRIQHVIEVSITWPHDKWLPLTQAS